ncbi:MAG: NAD(P)H-hydrate dehydratase [Roseburia sp.]|nr:NAD(P)H-hydrate dehydratase [Roseburia sp.]
MLCHSLFAIMKYMLSSQEMKEFDKNTIEHFGIPSMVLMERAALSVFQLIKERFPKTESVLVICGPGNNGGDGFAIARLLFLTGYPVSVYLPMNMDKMTGETRFQYMSAKRYEIPIAETLGKYDIIVDALFGIGLSRPLEGKLKDLIQWCNSQEAVRIAVDMPSGISADTGAILGEAFLAQITVTFGFAKIGQMLYPGAQYCGELVTADIGIDEHSMLGKKPGVSYLEDMDIKKFLPLRKKDSNKGSYGKVLVIAGSDKMAGAACFCAKAAYLAGCGLVQVFTPKANRDVLLSFLPEAIVTDYDMEKVDVALLREKMDWADVILVGPGIGTGDSAIFLVEEVLGQKEKRVVMDADALNILAKDMERLKQSENSIIVTPHLGEMSRLTEKTIPRIKESLLTQAEDFAKQYKVVCVLKDARTVIGTEEGLYVNLSGCDGMASGGSGDVLAGLIAGLLAQNISLKSAAVLGVFLHGRAGEEAAVEKGNASMLARDILDKIPIVIKRGSERS